jgi:hypothetical protein
MKNNFVALVLMAVLGLTAMMPATVQAQGPEVKIWKRVQLLLKRGQLLTACQMVEKLRPYKDTPTYDEAEIVLKKRGISIGDPLGSYTLMRIVALQNKLEDDRARTGRVPSPGPRSKYEDGWLKPIRVEIITRKGFAYMLRAAGKDGKWMTNDDYVIGVRSQQARAVHTKLPSLKKGARQKGKSSLFTSKSGGGGKGSNPLSKDEKSVTLDDLLKQ